MHDEADVRLVDAEPERVRCDDRGEPAFHEVVLRPSAVRSTEPAVVDTDVETGHSKRLPYRLRVTRCRDVDDAGCVGVRDELDERARLLGPVDEAPDPE